MLNSNPALALHRTFFNRTFFNRELGLSMAGWVLFLAGASLYCLIYNQMVLVSTISFMNSFLWSLREYAVWLVITPLLFFGLRRIHNQATKLAQGYSILIAITLTVVLLLQIETNPHAPYSQSSLAMLVDIFPSQLSVLCLLVALWHLFFRPINRQTVSSTAPDIHQDTQHNNHCDNYHHTVRVMKGNGEALVTWASVDFISAAGNYMELSCGSEKYLLRITLKELEQQLPAQRFIRVHRSHMVNIEAIHRIHNHNGNSVVELRNNHTVPLSKGYKPALEAIQLIPHSSQH